MRGYVMEVKDAIVCVRFSSWVEKENVKLLF